MKKFFILLLLSVGFQVYAQDDAVVLVIPNADSKILLDGLEKGVSKSGSSVRLETSAGEHYIEAQPINPALQTKGEVVLLESNKQKILKIQFEERLGSSVELIKVADLNISLPGVVTVSAWNSDHPNQNYPYPTQWFAFEKGDEIVLDATMSNRNGTNIINVLTYPDKVVRYSNNGFTELKDVRIKVEQRGIFAFVLATNHAFDRNCFLKIHRKPATAETTTFNSTVSLKKIYTPISIHEVQDFFINGGLNATFANGKSRITIPISLPENTVEWYYRFSASRNKEDIENVKTNFKLLSEVATATFGLTGVSGMVTESIFNNLAQPPGSDFCDIYLLPSEYRSTFEAKQDDQLRHYPDGGRQNFKSGNVRVTCCNTGQFYLGIKNPAATMGINVSIEVVAITVKEDYVMEYVQN
ncbi:hypothetical protein [Chryseosolibacter indicus]|uniref:PEGA domain-containing protein n=1 Tax=Chryseosolibacter indicus TaxID=2782351 RepID=A0ABS5VUQ5_9BACT|nr:hypothetical protein [Chryseosolibacter indicus]MBT1705153.1 hypothetical protein [Chryseosolibacter indicus]